ncbi:MAG: hypothetical protein ACE5I1_04055, partial [bacterium]
MKIANTFCNKLKVPAIAFAMISLCLFPNTLTATGSEGLNFEISFSADAHAKDITGRVYVIISRDNTREPRFQVGTRGVPFWGLDVFSLKPAEAASIDENVFGYPLKSLKDIPPGDYYVQGFVNIYTEFKRSDGHT